MVKNYLLEAGEDVGTSQQWADQTPVLTKKQQQLQATKEKFDFNKFQAIQGFEERINYANQTLKQIGEGQGRNVYVYNDRFVLKVAKDAGGIGQNKEESDVCNVPGTQGLFPKVSQFGKGFEWIIAELAAPMTVEAFQSLTGIAWKTFANSLWGAFPEKAGTRTPTPQWLQYAQQLIQTNPWFANVVNVIRSCQYLPGDIAKVQNWGILHGKPVIIDTGFTEAVKTAYYQKMSK